MWSKITATELQFTSYYSVFFFFIFNLFLLSTNIYGTSESNCMGVIDGITVSRTTNQLIGKDSDEFYKNIGYKCIESEGDKKRVYTDGDLFYSLTYDSEKPVSTELKLYTQNLDVVLEQLKKLNLKLHNKGTAESPCVFFEGADHLGVYILEGKGYKHSDDFSYDFGSFGEFSLKTGDRDSSMAFWEETQLGFKQIFTSNEPYPWGIMIGPIVLGIHHHENFGEEENKEQIEDLSACMTYFAKDMENHIQTLLQRGIVPYKTLGGTSEEKKGNWGNPSHICVAAPDGQNFFFFKGEIEKPPEDSDK